MPAFSGITESCVERTPACAAATLAYNERQAVQLVRKRG
jgi:hypothetical protein